MASFARHERSPAITGGLRGPLPPGGLGQALAPVAVERHHLRRLRRSGGPYKLVLCMKCFSYKSLNGVQHNLYDTPLY